MIFLLLNISERSNINSDNGLIMTVSITFKSPLPPFCFPAFFPIEANILSSSSKSIFAPYLSSTKFSIVLNLSFAIFVNTFGSSIKLNATILSPIRFSNSGLPSTLIK